MTELYLIRHAQSSGNVTLSFQGHTDAALSLQGKQQLEYLAKRFYNIELDKVYSSPLTRALKTAKAVNRSHKKEIAVDQRLIEINPGAVEGMPFAELRQKYPEPARLFLEEPESCVMPGGESMKQVYDRVSAAIMDIVEVNRNQRIAVVSHGCALRNMLAFLLGYGQQGVGKAPICYNTAISHLRVTESGLPFAVMVNDASHLSEELLAHGKWEPK